MVREKTVVRKASGKKRKNSFRESMLKDDHNPISRSSIVKTTNLEQCTNDVNNHGPIYVFPTLKLLVDYVKTSLH